MSSVAAETSAPSFLRHVFDNRPMRFFVLFVVTVATYSGAQIVQFVVIPHMAAATRENAAIASIAASALVLLLVYWIFVRLLEHRGVSELSLRRAPGGVI